MALGGKEGEAHAATDQQGVYAAQQCLDHTELVRYLGPAEQGHKWPLGRYSSQSTGPPPSRARTRPAAEGNSPGGPTMKARAR